MLHKTPQGAAGTKVPKFNKFRFIRSLRKITHSSGVITLTHSATLTKEQKMRVVGRWDVGKKLKKEEWGKQSKQSSGPIIVELMALKFFFIHVVSE